MLPKKIEIKSKNALAKLLGFPVNELVEISENTQQFVRQKLTNPGASGKPPREVLSIRGKLRQCQVRLLRRLFERCFVPSDWSHGGVKGRSIKSNAAVHLGANWVFATDVSSFYPSVHHSRVYRFFATDQGCSPPVARILTLLCTFDHHLALGLITSPILADQMFRPIDARLGGLAGQLGLVYTRYVDDIAFSGDFDFTDSGIPDLVVRAIAEHGFTVKRTKHKMGRALNPESTITQLRLKADKLDVRKEYLQNLLQTMRDLNALGNGENYVGEYLTRSQLEGKVRFVCWINPGRRKRLLSIFANLRWAEIEKEAELRGFVANARRSRRTEAGKERVPLL